MGKPKGYDTVRNVNPGYKNYKLHYFTEAFTSDKWIVRIYKRNKRGNREAIEILREGEYRKFLENTELPEKLKKVYKYAKKVKTVWFYVQTLLFDSHYFQTTFTGFNKIFFKLFVKSIHWSKHKKLIIINSKLSQIRKSYIISKSSS